MSRKALAKMAGYEVVPSKMFDGFWIWRNRETARASHAYRTETRAWTSAWMRATGKPQREIRVTRRKQK